MKQTLFPALLVVLLAISCGNHKQEADITVTSYNNEQNLPGDSTLYGLACEGCTDSVIVFLPYTGGDPDTFDILEARTRHQVFGRPGIGDKLAVVPSAADKSVADMVINIDVLQGKWCYEVMPTLRPRPDGLHAPALPDSLRRKWMQPREYGMEIRRDYVIRPTGTPRPGTAEQQTPVEYPKMKRYHEWHIFNGLLVLNETQADTLGNNKLLSSDTVSLTMLRKDTLVLRFADHEQGYYRKQ